MKSDDVCLITPLDVDRTVTDEEGKKNRRYYEEEAIRLFKSWRMAGGWLKDIPIYAVRYTCKDDIRQSTRKSLGELGVKVIDFIEKDTNNVDGFLSEPYCGYIFESGKIGHETGFRIKEEVFIKVDLDMVLFRPIPKELVEIAREGKVVVGQYDVKSSQTQRKTPNGTLPLDTNFLISSRDSGFYRDYFLACLSKEFLSEEWYADVLDRTGSYFLDECVVDYLADRRPELFHPVQYYQYGEGYPDLDMYTDEEISRFMFLHRHIYKDREFDIKGEILRIMRANAKRPHTVR